MSHRDPYIPTIRHHIKFTNKFTEEMNSDKYLSTLLDNMIYIHEKLNGDKKLDLNVLIEASNENMEDRYIIVVMNNDRRGVFVDRDAHALFEDMDLYRKYSAVLIRFQSASIDGRFSVELHIKKTLLPNRMPTDNRTRYDRLTDNKSSTKHQKKKKIQKRDRSPSRNTSSDSSSEEGWFQKGVQFIKKHIQSSSSEDSSS